MSVLLGLGATGLSVLGSWNASLWTDEAVTISAASRSWSSLWQMLGQVDAVHGFYYAIIHLWGSVVGFSPLALRLPSALAVGAATAGIYVLGYRLGGPRTGVAAAVVFAVLPRTTWMGMEGRSFAFGTAAVVALTCLLAAGAARRRWQYFAAYGVLAAVGTVVNVYVLLAVAAHGVSLLLLPTPRRVLLPWLGAAAGAGVAAAPLLLAVMGQRGQLGAPDLSVPRLVRSVLIDQWFLGETPTNSALPDSGDGLWQIAAILLAVLCWLLVLRALRTAGRHLLAAAIPLVVLPTVVLVLYSLALSPIYNPRYLAFAVPGMALLIGAGIAGLQNRVRTLTVWVLLGALTLPVYLSQRTEGAKDASDYSRIAAYVQDNAASGDGVYFGPRRPPEGRFAEQTQRRITAAYPEQFENLRDVTLLSSAEEDGSLDGQSLLLEETAARLPRIERLWAVRRIDYPAELVSAEDSWLTARGFRAQDSYTGTTNRVTLFVRTAP